MPRHPIIIEDCRRAYAATVQLWGAVAGRRVFITGGTGFFGSWFLELATFAMDATGGDCELVVLTRAPDAFLAGPAGHLGRHRCVTLWEGDVRDFVFPPGHFDYVAHFGSTGPKAWHDREPAQYFDVVVGGTRRVLDLAVQCGARRFLLASTGAVYGPALPPEPVGELYAGGPNPALLASANTESKRAAEFMTIAMAAAHPALAVAIARGFAFIGPYLPAHAKFAAYDFIQDAVAGRPLAILGDGTPVRSYLYGSDLAVWLWTLLLRAPGNTAWNVGSEYPVSVRDLAEQVASAAVPALPVTVASPATPASPASWYVPSTRKARIELGLSETIPLGTAIQRTVAWYREAADPVPCLA